MRVSVSWFRSDADAAGVTNVCGMLSVLPRSSRFLLAAFWPWPSSVSKMLVAILIMLCQFGPVQDLVVVDPLDSHGVKSLLQGKFGQ